MPVRRSTSLHSLISSDENEVVVHFADILTAPGRQSYFESDPFSHTRCSRALPMASEEDIVILSGPLDQEYYSWLRSNALGPKEVVSYNLERTTHSLPELVLENPDPVLQVLRESERKPIYVPFYTSQADVQCAELLGAILFGCEEEITRRYFDKHSFKEECRALDIPIVPGDVHQLDTASPLNYEQMEETVGRLLSNYGKVIIRSTEGAGGGLSLFTAESPDIQELYETLVKNKEKAVLIEPLLQVISSPNDQWMIDRNGSVNHVGLSAQLFQGLKHVGNLEGQYYSPRVQEYISSVSEKIVLRMKEFGYRGVLGIDYIICDEGIYPIENNARMNGSSYTYGIADAVAQKVGLPSCWKFFKAKTEPCSFSGLAKRIEKVIYDGKRTNSVFPYDTDMLHRNGVFAAAIFAEDMYHIDYLQEALSYMGIARL